MKGSRVISVLLTLLSVLFLSEPFSSAQQNDRSDIRFAYDVGFMMDFDNREFYRSNFTNSMTIFGARLSPSVGIAVVQNEDTYHKVMVGVDAMKDFGNRSRKDPIGELTLNYSLRKRFRGNEFSLIAGIFSRDYMEGSYSQAFFSDSLRFYDNNLEGILLKLKKPKAYFELGCDWLGQIGKGSRERFMVFSSGEGALAPVLRLGYSAYMYHFADSYEVNGVVDNILVNPYVRLLFNDMARVQKLEMRVGWLQSFQHDRRNVGHYVFPGGAELDFEICNWNVGLRNSLFAGKDLMPYYNSTDAGGFKYGTGLYFGDPFYRVYDDGTERIGTYDRLEAYYEPSIGKYLRIRVAALFHFNNLRYSGCQQMVVLKFDLQELLNRNKNQ